MKSLINPNRFINAVSYANKHYFSVPYGLTPVVDRWFSQKSMILLDNDEIVSLSAENGVKFSTIKISRSFNEVMDFLQKEQTKSSPSQVTNKIQELTDLHQEYQRAKKEDAQSAVTKEIEKRLNQFLAQYNEAVSSDDVKMIRQIFTRESTFFNPYDSGLAHSGKNVDEMVCHQKERFSRYKKQLNHEIRELEQQLDENREGEINSEKEENITRITEKIKELEKLLLTKQDNFDRSASLLKRICKHGHLDINYALIEKEKKAKVKKVIHRPNHGLHHSVRAAFDITMICAHQRKYNRHSTSASTLLDDNELERLQLMMLFSVTGREDETGFKDTGGYEIGWEVYTKFRKQSAKAYINYFKENPVHAKALYGTDWQKNRKLYQDAAIVKLMGASNIPAADLVNIEEFVGGEMLNTRVLRYQSYGDLFPKGSERDKSNKLLKMMNDSHAIELLRCYSLKKQKKGGSSIIGEFKRALVLSNVIQPYSSKEPVSEQGLKDAFDKIRYSYDLLLATGSKATMSMISTNDYSKVKEELISKIDNLKKEFNFKGNREKLIQEARDELRKEPPEGQFSVGDPLRISNNDLLTEYYEFKIVEELADCVFLTSNYTLDLIYQARENLSKGEGYHPLVSEKFTTQLSETKQKIKSIEAQINKQNTKPKLIERIKILQARIVEKIKTGQTLIETDFNYQLQEGEGDDELINAFIEFEMKSYYQSLSLKEKSLIDKINCYKQFKVNEWLATSLFSDKKAALNKQMFDSENQKDDGTEEMDHLRNASNLVRSLDNVNSPFGVGKSQEFPLITRVDRSSQNGTDIIFDTKSEYDKFASLYSSLFSDKLECLVISDGSVKTSINNENYQELFDNKLLKFKEVVIPKKNSCDDDLVSDEGELSVLNIISQTKAMVRICSSTSLNNERKNPEYEYMFDALDDPMHQRWSHELRNELKRLEWRSPKDGTVTHRQYEKGGVRGIEFQEPIIDVKSTQKNREKVWRINEKRYQAKNSIFAKKMAFSLIGNSGNLNGFSGYKGTQDKFMALGVLVGTDDVDMIDEKYVWKSNASTAFRPWLLDSQEKVDEVHKLLATTQLTQVTLNKQTPLIIQSKTSKLWQEVIQTLNSTRGIKGHDLVAIQKKLLSQYKMALSLLNKPEVAASFDDDKPSDSNLRLLEDFRTRLAQNFELVNERINTFIREEPSKRAVTFNELKEHVNNPDNPDSERCNEVLAKCSKQSVKALCANNDRLIYRLNLILHAKNIKEKYGHDVPLLIITENNPPRLYQESEMRDDLNEAQKLLVAGKFPFDDSLSPLFEKDNSSATDLGFSKKGKFGIGNIVKDKDGNDVLIKKSRKLQEQVLLDIFKIAMPSLKGLQQIRNKNSCFCYLNNSSKSTDEVSTTIIENLNVVGNERRESERVQRILEEGDQLKIQALFLREVSLGHMSLVKKIVNQDFGVNSLCMENAIALAKKKNHNQLHNYLQKEFLDNKKQYETLFNKFIVLRDHQDKSREDWQKEFLFLIQDIRSLAKNYIVCQLENTIFSYFGEEKNSNVFSKTVIFLKEKLTKIEFDIFLKEVGEESSEKIMLTLLNDETKSPNDFLGLIKGKKLSLIKNSYSKNIDLLSQLNNTGIVNDYLMLLVKEDKQHADQYFKVFNAVEAHEKKERYLSTFMGLLTLKEELAQVFFMEAHRDDLSISDNICYLYENFGEEQINNYLSLLNKATENNKLMSDKYIEILKGLSQEDSESYYLYSMSLEGKHLDNYQLLSLSDMSYAKIYANLANNNPVIAELFMELVKKSPEDLKSILVRFDYDPIKVENFYKIPKESQKKYLAWLDKNENSKLFDLVTYLFLNATDNHLEALKALYVRDERGDSDYVNALILLFKKHGGDVCRQVLEFDFNIKLDIKEVKSPYYMHTYTLFDSTEMYDAHSDKASGVLQSGKIFKKDEVDIDNLNLCIDLNRYIQHRKALQKEHVSDKVKLYFRTGEYLSLFSAIGGLFSWGKHRSATVKISAASKAVKWLNGTADAEDILTKEEIRSLKDGKLGRMLGKNKVKEMSQESVDYANRHQIHLG